MAEVCAHLQLGMDESAALDLLRGAGAAGARQSDAVLGLRLRECQRTSDHVACTWELREGGAWRLCVCVCACVWRGEEGEGGRLDSQGGRRSFWEEGEGAGFRWQVETRKEA